MWFDGADAAATTQYLDAMVAADTPDDVSKIVEFWTFNVIVVRQPRNVDDSGRSPRAEPPGRRLRGHSRTKTGIFLSVSACSSA